MHRNEKILVIAEGAAFGSEIARVLQLIKGRKNIAIYLPESVLDVPTTCISAVGIPGIIHFHDRYLLNFC